MIGLKRGTVELLPHQMIWETKAAGTIHLLKEILNDVAIDIQHIGSTAIQNIHAKPIIDIAVAVDNLNNIKPYIGVLAENGIMFRKEDVKEQLLFVIGNFEREFRTHHIHVVEWNSVAWNNYINFRDYLNAFPEYAKEYDALKKKLALEFADNRGYYTAGKQELIEKLLKQAYMWKTKSSII
ncbi:MAG: GrpB family protein [Clostridia bacterium]|nr:GrpB family protein [Clostridia bacterium]